MLDPWILYGNCGSLAAALATAAPPSQVPPRLRTFSRMAHALRKPLPPADPHNPRVYVDVCIGAEEEPGAVETPADTTPRAAPLTRLRFSRAPHLGAVCGARAARG